MKIVFMGTPEFALTALKALGEKHDILCVYTREPKPAGRGHKLTPSPVHAYALEKGYEVRTPKTLRTPQAAQEFAGLKADVAVVAAYGMILPAAFLTAFKYGCLNIHGSLLPRWRGAAPIQRAVMEGDFETGVTIMQMDEGMDTGDMLMRLKTPITEQDTSETLYERLAQIGAQGMLDTLDALEKGTISPVRQDESQATHAPKISKEEGAIDWTMPARKIDCRLRGLAPYPAAWFMCSDERITVLKAQIVENPANAPAGTVLDDKFTIACGQDALRPLILKRAGKAAMEAAVFLNGFKAPVGTVLQNAAL